MDEKIVQVFNHGLVDRLVCKCGLEIKVNETTPNVLETHLLTVHKDLNVEVKNETYQCVLCNKHLKTSKGLNLHVKRKHKQTEDLVENITNVLCEV